MDIYNVGDTIAFYDEDFMDHTVVIIARREIPGRPLEYEYTVAMDSHDLGFPGPSRTVGKTITEDRIYGYQ